MRGPWAESVADHEAFAREGQGDALRRLLRRHGPLLLGLAATGSGEARPEATLTRVVSGVVARRYRGAPEQWLPQLLRAVVSANPADTDARADGRRALWLAGYAGLDPETLATIFRRAPEAVVAEMVEAMLGGGETEAGARIEAFHLAPHVVAAYCAGLLADAPLARATAHLSFCDTCREGAAVLGRALADAHAAPLPEMTPQLIEAIVTEAREERMRQARWPRMLRFCGLKPGAAWRPLRLGIVSTLALLFVLSALTSIHHKVVSERTLTSTLSIRNTGRLTAGGVAAISVQIADATGKKPDVGAGVEVTARLLGTAGRDLGHATAKADAAGIATLVLPIEALSSARESATLVAEAEVAGERRRAETNVDVVRALRQHLSADKPTYQPGQTIHLRGLSLDAGSGKPLAGRPAHLILRDPRGNRISDTVAEVSPMGVTSADIELSPGAALGRYTGELLVEGESTTVALKVERYQLPPFAVTVTPKVASTDGKTPFAVEVEAKFTTGVPMARGMARLSVSADGGEIFQDAATIQNGVAKFQVTVPSWLADARWRPPTTLVLHATVRDPAGRAEMGNGGVELAGDAMAVTVVSEASSVRRNLPRANHILVRAQRPDASPVETLVELFAPGDDDLQTVGSGERLGEARTGPDGLAKLDLPPAFFGRPLGVLAKDPKDGKQYWTTIQAPPTREGSLVLGCDRSLLRGGEQVTCEVFVPSPRARIVRVERAGQIVAVATSPATQGLAQVNLTVPTPITGLLRVTMEDAPSEDAVYLLAAPHDGLRVELSGLEPRRPGEETTLKMRVTDGAGKPRAAAVGLAVVDAAVFARSAGTTPRQIIQALFAHPDVAPAGMALLFPEPVAASEAAPPGWSPTQQTNARWLLASTTAAGADVQQASSESRDRIAMAIAAGEAGSRARTLSEITMLAFAAAVLLTLLVVSFWFRTGFGALCAALVIGLMLELLLTRGLDMRSQTVDPVALLVALGVFASLMFSAARRRTAEAAGVAVAARAEGRALRIVLVGAPVALVAVALLFATTSLRRGGMHYDSAPASPTGGYFAREEAAMAKNVAPAPMPQAAPASGAFGLADAPAAMEAEKSTGGLGMDGAGPGGGGFSEEGRMGRAPARSSSQRFAISGSPKSAADAAPEVATRQDFPETLYFNPAAVVGEDGAGEVSFRVADSITTWEAHALASDTRGVLGAGTGKLVVNKPFHVDVDVPMDLTTGDDVTLQVAVQNERDVGGAALVTATADPGLTLDTKPLEDPVSVAANGIAGRLVPLKAKGPGQQFVTVSGALGGEKDALKRAIQVAPKGREVRTTAAGLVIDKVRRTIDLPADAFVEGRSVVLTLLGSPLAAALDGLDLVAAEPHGSFEQQASTIYANALILKALRATGRVIPAQEKALLRLLRLSYQDLLGYETSGGGFSAFGRGADLTPTAWGLLVLMEIAPHTYIDPDLLERTRAFLTGQQAGDGAFGGPTETAYVALAMLSSDPECLSTEDPTKPWTPALRMSRAACRKVVQRLEEAFSMVEGVDSYTLAWAADALIAAGASHRVRAEALLDELDRRAAIVGEGRERRVSFRPRGATLYGARGISAEVETTAVVAHALVRHGGRGDKAREAMRALLVLRDPGGGFYSTQGTALALRAMLAAAQAGQAGGRAIVKLDGSEVGTIEFDPSNITAPQRVDLTDKVRPGAELVVELGSWDGATDMAYRLTTHHFEPWTRPPGPPIVLDGQAPEERAALYMAQMLDATNYGLGDQAMLTIDIDRRGGRAANGLLIAQVGLPPGFRLAEHALDEGAIGNTLRIEPAARGLTVYLEDIGYGRTGLSIPLVAARAVRSVVVPRSRVYFAYQPQIEAQAAPVPVYVKATLGKRTGG